MKDDLTHFALGLGIASPFLYFGIQLLALPFFPGYNPLSMDASALGSAGARLPAVFNIGAVITGMITLVAAPGFFRALAGLGVDWTVTIIASTAVGLNGMSSIWAGLFPLPDPLHAVNPFMPGVFLFPPLLLVAVRRMKGAGWLSAYLALNILFSLLLLPFVFVPAFTGLDGLMQRLVALVFLPPVGAGAYFLSIQTAPETNDISGSRL